KRIEELQYQQDVEQALQAAEVIQTYIFPSQQKHQAFASELMQSLIQVHQLPGQAEQYQQANGWGVRLSVEEPKLDIPFIDLAFIPADNQVRIAYSLQNSPLRSQRTHLAEVAILAHLCQLIGQQTGQSVVGL